MSFGMEVELGLGDFVLDGDLAPSTKWVTVPQFSAHVYCYQRLDVTRCHLLGR